MEGGRRLKGWGWWEAEQKEEVRCRCPSSAFAVARLGVEIAEGETDAVKKLVERRWS